MESKYQDIVKNMSKLTLLHRIHIQKMAAANGLYPGQLPILEYILQNDNCTQKEIAEHLQVSPASVATSIKRMQRSGLVEKITDKSDLRYNRITLTDMGRKVVTKSRKDFNKVDKLLFKGFSDDEIKELCGYFERMIDNLSSEGYDNRSFFSLVAEIKTLVKDKSKEDEPNG